MFSFSKDSAVVCMNDKKMKESVQLAYHRFVLIGLEVFSHFREYGELVFFSLVGYHDV